MAQAGKQYVQHRVAVKWCRDAMLNSGIEDEWQYTRITPWQGKQDDIPSPDHIFVLFQILSTRNKLPMGDPQSK